MEFNLKPFTKQEASKNYEYVKFKERGHPMAVLVDKDSRRIKRTNYSFGCIDKNGNYFWFFQGQAVASDRFNALSYFNALSLYCAENNIGKPFVFRK